MDAVLTNKNGCSMMNTRYNYFPLKKNLRRLRSATSYFFFFFAAFFLVAIVKFLLENLRPLGRGPDKPKA